MTTNKVSHSTQYIWWEKHFLSEDDIIDHFVVDGDVTISEKVQINERKLKGIPDSKAKAFQASIERLLQLHNICNVHMWTGGLDGLLINPQ